MGTKTTTTWKITNPDGTTRQPTEAELQVWTAPGSGSLFSPEGAMVGRKGEMLYPSTTSQAYIDQQNEIAKALTLGSAYSGSIFSKPLIGPSGLAVAPPTSNNTTTLPPPSVKPPEDSGFAPYTSWEDLVNSNFGTKMAKGGVVRGGGKAQRGVGRGKVVGQTMAGGGLVRGGGKAQRGLKFSKKMG